MRSTNQRYLLAVDQLRAVACVLVLLYHAVRIPGAERQGAHARLATSWPYSRNPLKTLVYEGHTGVALFLVLSGFIFTVGALGKQITYHRFLLNRLLRIYPLYLVMLSIGIWSSGGVTLEALLRAVLPLADYPGAAAANTVWGAVFWTVAVELQFYLVFPFLLRLLNRFGPPVLLALIAVMVLARVTTWLLDPTVDLNRMNYYTLFGRIDQLLLGMLAGWVWVRRREWIRPGLLPVAAASVVAMLWLFNQLHGFAEPRGWRIVWVDLEGLVWAAFLLGYLVVLGERHGRFARLVASAGATSFSVYLLHGVVLTRITTPAHHLRIEVGGPLTEGFLTGLFVGLPITLALSAMTYNGIERPFLARRVSYLVGSGRPAQPAAMADRT